MDPEVDIIVDLFDASPGAVLRVSEQEHPHP